MKILPLKLARSETAGHDAKLLFALCPLCFRAVPLLGPVQHHEKYCSNDGTRLLVTCPKCAAPILSPVARYCTQCGVNLSGSGEAV